MFRGRIWGKITSIVSGLARDPDSQQHRIGRRSLPASSVPLPLGELVRIRTSVADRRG